MLLFMLLLLYSSTTLHKPSKKRKAVIQDDDIEEMGSNDLFEVISNKDESNSDEDVVRVYLFINF